MNGLFGNFSMMNPQGGQGQLSGFGRGVGGYQMPQVQAPQQDLSAYYNKPMISQQQYGDWLRSERPMRFMMDFAVPAIQGDERKLQYFKDKSNTTL